MRKRLYIFEALLSSHGLMLKSCCILAASSMDAVAIAQNVMGICESATIIVQRKPETFFKCHG